MNDAELFIAVGVIITLQIEVLAGLIGLAVWLVVNHVRNK